MTLVLDASAVVQLLAGDPGLPPVVRGHDLWSVHLMPFEVLNVLRRHELVGRISPPAARAMVDDLARLPIELVGAERLTPSIWRLRGALTAYDAAYAALALALDCPLVTADARLARATPTGLAVQVV